MPNQFYLLPGLDGTGRLFRGFCDAADPSHTTTVLPLPTNTQQDYESLARELSAVVAGASKAVVIAESFSGPIAVKIAARHPASVSAVVLVASFVTPPAPAVARLVPWSLILRLPVPAFAARRLILGATARDDLVHALQRSVREVPPKILAQRIRELTYLNACKELFAVKCPIMYLRPSADRLVPKHCIDALRESKADLEFREIEGPHLILQREPVNAWCAISDFLSGIPSIGRID